MKPPIRVHRLGQRDYEPVWRAMQDFTTGRGEDTADEIWQVEHPPVFTLGMNGKPEHVLDAGDIPVIPVDRGGQVTYHGPGQVVIYLLLDVRRQGMGVRALVTTLERTVIDYLEGLGIQAQARADAPGVYVGGAKIAALGLRVRRGGSYHGLAFNVNPDLSAFARINPCGHQGLATTSLEQLGVDVSWGEAAEGLTLGLGAALGRRIEWVPSAPLIPG
ncbi:lipoate--protein ligase [Ectothiorhodospira haloalkaliphila]|uniref:Octanoyltransferase n=1 Tax=Ectothiorhodospira haloalkaliphila TaxID=421628 RepID=W8KGS0_9GAMM|nr:lipoyl(octanoyl) transferase LipB [Ectothiorhodospira haloalkaliphila]AHK78378.1 lipoate--protein ligase [Ectothiorhodospira haloalkaliphila]